MFSSLEPYVITISIVAIAVLPYRVLIFPSRRLNLSTTTANVWVSVSGTLGETGPLSVPKNSLEFVFEVGVTKLVGHYNLDVNTN